MFSSSKNSHFPPPSFDTSTSFHCLNSSETLLRHHHDMFSGHYNLVDNSPVLQGAIDDLPVPSDTALGYNQDVDMLGTTVNAFPRRKRTVKNDRHSKIFTATGPRDRRVRLSISIARKFFDLQDMLDFDKPSKTLDWLLTKSKTAINELIRTKRSTDNVHSTPSECGNNKAEENCWESLGTDLKNKSLINATNSEEVKDPQQASALLTARDSRAKARARARERTREKKCSKGLSVQAKQVSDFSNSIPSQSRPSNSVLGTFQQNHIASSDLNPYCSASSPNYDADQDWDISSIIRQSSS